MSSVKRIPLKERILPSYTVGEERINYISHIVGGALGVAALVLCVVFAALHKSAWAVVSSAVYGAFTILLYTMSGIYHGLPKGTAKKVLQVLDHCTIYFMIGGTYTPILLCAIRPLSPGWAWTLFGIVWGLGILATVLTAIDLKKYSVFSMICYLGMGWCIVIAMPLVLKSIGIAGFLWLVAGGVAYTVGAVLYGLGKNHKYMHSVFHFFVLLGSVLQFVCVFWYVI